MHFHSPVACNDRGRSGHSMDLSALARTPMWMAEILLLELSLPLVRKPKSGTRARHQTWVL